MLTLIWCSLGVVVTYSYTSSSSRIRVIYHNWSATKHILKSGDCPLVLYRCLVWYGYCFWYLQLPSYLAWCVLCRCLAWYGYSLWYLQLPWCVLCRCLAWYGYSLWYLLLPSYLASNVRQSITRLHEAFAVLQRMHKLGLPPLDEVGVSSFTVNVCWSILCIVSCNSALQQRVQRVF